jgi:hypothetical protein
MTNNSKFLLLLLIFLGLNASLFAQIEGVVQGNNNEKISPLPGAVVQHLPSNTANTTDSLGRFSFPSWENGNQLIVSMTGFKSDTILFDRQQSLSLILEQKSMLGEVEVQGGKQSTLLSTINPIKTEIITETELYKAACCNLSESFQNSATVDISTTNAITGSKEIQMLGLAGIYTQLSVENLPLMRGLGINSALNMVPGSWVESIQVSKGVGSVANGYESVAGQINTELKKPDCKSDGLLNAYLNNMGRMEANYIKVFRINDRWSSNVLAHASHMNNALDQNGDGFMDSPDGGQANIMHRWMYVGPKGLSSQLAVRFVQDERHAGTVHTGSNPLVDHNFHYYHKTQQADALFKMGYKFPGKPYKSIGILGNAQYYKQKDTFDNRWYDAKQMSYNGNLFYQSIIGNSNHKFRTGANVQADQYDEYYIGTPFLRNETVVGAFFEYTGYYGRSTLVTGLRGDINNLFGSFLTPRVHYKFQWTDKFSIRASGGRGQRTANVIAENFAYLVSARDLRFQTSVLGSISPAYDLRPEIAWNGGTSLQFDFRIGKRDGTLAADAYYTWFERQVMVDLEGDAQLVHFYNVEGKTSSTSLQLDYYQEIGNRFNLKLAYRFTDARVYYNSTGEIERPFTAMHRALANLSFHSRKDKWMVDLTVNYIGSKRLPSTAGNPVEYRMDDRSPDYALVNAQVTRNFKKVAVYIGGENLTNVRQSRQIISPENPHSGFFDASFIWGPTFGAMVYTGVRWTF